METLVLLLDQNRLSRVAEALVSQSDFAITCAVCLTIITVTALVVIIMPRWHKRLIKENQDMRQHEIDKAYIERRDKTMADYQLKILDYIEKHKDEKGFNIEEDSYIKQINKYIQQL